MESTQANPVKEPGASTEESVSVQKALFSDLATSEGDPATTASLQNLLDVSVKVRAELGQTRLQIGEVLKLGVGSVICLDRAVSEPVELMVEGVCLARGEVVVVNDRFAIRIQHIPRPQKTAS